MENWAKIFMLLGIISAIVLIGFLIVFVIGLVIKKSAPKTVGKLGLIFAAVFLVIGFAGNKIVTGRIEVQEAKEEKEEREIAKAANAKFRKASSSLVANVYSAITLSEDAANAIQDGWGDAIDNSSDDFDVDETINALVSENQTKIDSMQSALTEAKNDLDTMENNDTGKYDFDYYNGLYKHASKVANFTAAPSGSYSTFADTYNEYHTKVDDDLAELDD